ncbi:MAG: FixH family protein [Gammaproteobacteria bacterium]|nr:FixH family protein [Gammaproteobacteria bacterium]
MADLVSSILLGIVLIVAGFFVFHLWLKRSGKISATIMALLCVGLYLPYSFINWPGGDVFAMHMAIYMVTAYMLGIVSSYREKRVASEGKDTTWFHWGPAIIVVFFIGVVTIGSTFVTIATKGVNSDVAKWLLPEPRGGANVVESHFPGTVSNDYQKTQAEYNDYLKRLIEQKQRGWTLKKGWLSTPHVGEKQVFQLEVNNAEGKSLAGAKIVGRFLRPSNIKNDVDFVMQEVSRGLYQTELALRYPGNWNMVLYIRHGDDLHELQASTYIEAAR